MNTLTVFWEGTANTLNPPTTQIGPYFFRCRFLVTAMYIPGLFAAATQAVDISADEPLPLLTTTAPAHFKMAFDGCAVTHGMTGLLFAAGLRSQTRWVKRRIEQILQVYGSPVRCNVLGLSRGGVAAIFLGQACEEFKKSQVELNLLLFDPVPGDQTWSGFPWSGAYGKDLTRCACLSRVLAIYPHEPLPDITFHAPILVAVSSDVDFEEDVTLGCHQGALFATRRSNHSVHCASNLSFRRIVNFFDDVGTPLDLDSYFPYQPTDADCLDICRAALLHDQPTRRKLHDALNRNRCIIRRSFGLYLNKYHQSIEPSSTKKNKVSQQHQKLNPVLFLDPKPSLMLDIEWPESNRSCFGVH